MSTATHRRLQARQDARARVAAGMVIAKRATEKWAFKVLQKAIPELHKLMRYDESTQFREDARLGTVTAYEPSREKGRDSEWEHTWGLHHDEDGYYVSVLHQNRESVLDIDVADMNPKGVAEKLYQAGGKKIKMGTYAATRVRAASEQEKAVAATLKKLAPKLGLGKVQSAPHGVRILTSKGAWDLWAAETRGVVELLVSFEDKKGNSHEGSEKLKSTDEATVQKAVQLLIRETKGNMPTASTRVKAAPDAQNLRRGAIFEDTSGSTYKVLAPYSENRKLGDGSPDEGYKSEALRGSLVSRGSIYHVPYVRVGKVLKAASNPEVVRDLKQMGILPETENPADYPQIGQDDTWESLEVPAAVKKDIIATLIKEGKTALANQASKALTTSHQVSAASRKIEKVYSKLPGTEYKEIFTNGTFSNWDGKLASVYWPFKSDYNADDFVPEDLLRLYVVHFVDDGKGKPLKVDDYWKSLVGQNYNGAGGNKFFGSRSDFGAGGRGFTGEFLNSVTFGLKIKLKDMGPGEAREYVGYLEKLGYIDASDAKVSAAMWKKFLTAKTWDELYAMDPKTDSANAAYKLIDWALKDDSDAVLKKVKGVYSVAKKGKIRFVVPPPKAGAKASVNAASNPEVVNELKTMGILPESENPADYPQIGQDDTWEGLNEVPAATRKDVIATLLRAGKPELANAASKLLVTAGEVNKKAFVESFQTFQTHMIEAGDNLGEIIGILKAAGKEGSSAGKKFKKMVKMVNEMSLTTKLQPDMKDMKELGLVTAASKMVTALKLSPREKSVILAFIDHKAQEGRKLSTDGKRLDGLWMGGRGIAEWEGGKIHFNDLGSKAAQTVQTAIKKMAAPNDIAASTVTAAAPAEDAFKHELQGYFKKKLYQAVVANDAEMLDLVHKGKYPQKRMEYGIGRYRSGSQTEEDFMAELLDAYASWSSDLKGQLR